MRYLSAGESHGPFLSAIIEGLPADLEITTEAINFDLWRRQQGYGRGGRMKIEKDQVKILSGLRFNKTLGTPLTLQIKNRDWPNWKALMAAEREGPGPGEDEVLSRPRPGHADLSGALKFNHDDLRNVLERASARETAIRVAVGAVARLFLANFGIKIFSHVVRIGQVKADAQINLLPENYQAVEASPVRCLDRAATKEMIEEIERAKKDGDTLGGLIEVLVTGLPPGLGTYSYPEGRLEARLAGPLMSIQAIKAVEIGAGVSAAELRGKDFHDEIIKDDEGKITRSTNRAGGIEGGLSSGMPLVVRLAMKPIPTLLKPLKSVDLKTGSLCLGTIERSDVCAVPAAAVVAEAVCAWVLAQAFREKFAGDFLEETEAAYRFYMERVTKRLHFKT